MYCTFRTGVLNKKQILNESYWSKVYSWSNYLEIIYAILPPPVCIRHTIVHEMWRQPSLTSCPYVLFFETWTITDPANPVFTLKEIYPLKHACVGICLGPMGNHVRGFFPFHLVLENSFNIIQFKASSAGQLLFINV